MIVDDDETLREVLAGALRDRGYEVRTASHHAEAVAIAQQDPPEHVVVDLCMPGPSGLELIRALKAIEPETRIVVLTGYGSIATALDATRLGACHYLQKPADADEVLAAFTRGPTPVDDSAPLNFPPPSLERVKWEHISRVLSDCGGNISIAARRLGMHRRTLQRFLQKHPPGR
jgi:two-component system response regulator RegA